MILCIGTTPAVQRVMVFRRLLPDTVNRAVTTLDGAAGKSVNVAKVLKVLGEPSVATGFLGGDRGEFIRATLAEKGVESDFVTVAARTRQCLTAIDESACTHTELVEESRAVEPADYDRLVAIIQRRMAGCRAVVMSGSITPGGPADLYFRCAQWAHAAGAFPVVDAQGPSLLSALKAKPALIKPNRAELAATVLRKLDDDAAMMEAMRELCGRGAQRIVVTAGKEPALAFDGQSFWKIIPPRIKVANPIGSGDAVTAGIVWRLARGDDLGEACRWGHAAGAANALTLMPGDVNRQDVDRLAPTVEVHRIG
jgi:tagatose 6-phosphate kinase